MIADVTIYALCEPDTDEVRYIGRSTNPRIRLYAHEGHARQGTRHVPSSEWVRGLLALGKKPLLRVLEVVAVNEAAAAEQRAIAAYRSAGCRLLNATHNGGGGRPRKGPSLLDRNMTIHMPPALREQLIEAAKIDRRRIGEFTRILLEDAFKDWQRAHQNQGKQDGEQ